MRIPASRPALWFIICVMASVVFLISLSRSNEMDPPSIDPPFYVPGEVLIRFRLETTPEEYEQALERVGAQKAHAFLSGAERWTEVSSDNSAIASETDMFSGMGEVFQRCTWTSSYGSNGCCQYSCALDETCEEVDPVPTHACGNYCL